jgi:hypothetical protein
MSPKPTKRPASQNALKHGLASSTIVIPGENPEELRALELALFDQYKPANPTESLLVADLVKHHWLKDRALRLQGEALATAAPGELPATFPVLLRYQTTNDRAFHKALDTLQVLQFDRIDQERALVSQEQEMEIMQRMFAPIPNFAEQAQKAREAHMNKQKAPQTASAA